MFIRKARIEDTSIITELSIQLGYQSTPEQTEKRLIEVIESSDHALFLACLKEGAVVGWIHVYKSLRVESDCFAEIGGLVVSEGYRSRGFGKKLIQEAEVWAIQKDIEKLRVRSRRDRSDALKFYQCLGFSKVKTQQVLDKALTPS